MFQCKDTIFGNAPESTGSSLEYEKYISDIDKTWKLQGLVVDKTPDAPVKMISINQPKTHTSIIKGSQGSKIFEMLQNIKPSARVQQNPPPKDEVPTETKRKIKTK